MLVNLRRHKIEKVCADEKLQHIAQPWLDTYNKVIVATDTHTLAVVPVDISPTDKPGPIPLLALDAARLKSSKDFTADIVSNGTVDVPPPEQPTSAPSSRNCSTGNNSSRPTAAHGSRSASTHGSSGTSRKHLAPTDYASKSTDPNKRSTCAHSDTTGRD